MKQVLFQPFDLGKWFIIGFCAWLAQLGEQGFSFNFPSSSSSRRGGGAGEGLEQARDFAMQNLWWIVPLIVTLICVVIGLWLVFTWLSSRGKFMFLHCVALNRAEVSAPWSQFSRQGNSLFLFRIVLGLISFLVTLPFLVLAALAVFSMVRHEAATVFGVLVLIALVLGLILVAIVFFLVRKFTMDFVVPVMFLRGNSCQFVPGELEGIPGPAPRQSRSFSPLFALPARAGHRHRRNSPGHHSRDLLPRGLSHGHSLHWYGAVAAGLCVQPLLLTALLRAVWTAIRRVPVNGS